MTVFGTSPAYLQLLRRTRLRAGAGRSTSAPCAPCCPPARSCTTRCSTGSRDARAGGCRCSRSRAAPTSSAASCWAIRTCRSIAARASASASASTCARWRRPTTPADGHRRAGLRATRSRRGRWAFSATPTAARFHAAYFAQNPGVWTHGDLIELTARGTGAHPRPHRRRPERPRHPHRPGGDLRRSLAGVPEVTQAMAVEQQRPPKPGGTRLVLLWCCSGPGARPPAELPDQAGAHGAGLDAHVPAAIAQVGGLAGDLQRQARSAPRATPSTGARS